MENFIYSKKCNENKVVTMTNENLEYFVNDLTKRTMAIEPKKQIYFEAEKKLYLALLAYIRDWCSPNKFNIFTLYELVDKAVNNIDEIDLIFKEIETGYGYAMPGKHKVADVYIEQTGKQELVDLITKLDSLLSLKGIEADIKQIYCSLGCEVRRPKAGLVDVPSPLKNYRDNYCPFDLWLSDGVLPDKTNYKYQNDFCVKMFKEFIGLAKNDLSDILKFCFRRIYTLSPYDFCSIQFNLEKDEK